MDRLVSIFSLSDFLAFILPGGLTLTGAWWAYRDLPRDIGLVEALATLGLFYVAGRFVQSIGALWSTWFERKWGRAEEERLNGAGAESYQRLVRGAAERCLGADIHTITLIIGCSSYARLPVGGTRRIALTR